MQILIVKVSSLGDIVHTIPIVHDILSHYPKARIDWVVEENFIDLLKLVTGIRTIIPLALRRWRKTLFNIKIYQELYTFFRALRLNTYDLILDPQGLIKSALITRLARRNKQSYIWGFANQTAESGYEWPARYFYHHAVSMPTEIHALTRARLLAAKALHYPLSYPINFGFITQNVVRDSALPYIIFIHSTSAEKKMWLENNWIALGKILIQQGYFILLPWGSAAEHLRSQRIAAQLGDKAYVLPWMNLTKISALLQRAKGIVGVNTGLTHLAAALGKSGVALYALGDLQAWRVGAFWSPHLIHIGEALTQPSYQEVANALHQLSLITYMQRSLD